MAVWLVVLLEKHTDHRQALVGEEVKHGSDFLKHFEMFEYKDAVHVTDIFIHVGLKFHFMN